MEHEMAFASPFGVVFKNAVFITTIPYSRDFKLEIAAR
jgi:hypothetical protein